MKEPRPAMISARPPDNRSTVANCWYTRTGSSELNTVTPLDNLIFFVRSAAAVRELRKLLESRKRLGKGELSSIAFAMKIGQAVITDDMKARKLAEDSGHVHIQTTPHLFSWLIFKGRLSDFDKGAVIAQHRDMDRPLAPHFEKAYEMALQCRLNALP